MKRKIGMTILIGALAAVLFVSLGPKIKRWTIAHQTKIFYQNLMLNQGQKNPETLLKTALKQKKSQTLQLVIYKRTCPYCQKEKERIKKKVDELKKQGNLILVVEAPQKGIVSAFPSWAKQFEIPQISVPIIIEYPLGKNNNFLLKAKVMRSFNLKDNNWQEIEA